MPEETNLIPLHNIYVAFQVLGQCVGHSLHSQLGDASCLNEERHLCLQFLGIVNFVCTSQVLFHLIYLLKSLCDQHAATIPRAEHQTLTSSVQRMIEALDTASMASLDLPDGPAPVLGECVSTSHPGRPFIDIDPYELAILSTGHTTHQQIADLYGCSAHTIRRRLLTYGLSTPGPPVHTQEEQPNGTISRTYHAGTSSDLSTITDSELDSIILTLYLQFPSFGHQMIDGYLIQLGERVP